MYELGRECTHQCGRDEREQDQFGCVVKERDGINRKGDHGIQRHAAEIRCVADPECQALDQDHECCKDSRRAQRSNQEASQSIPGILTGKPVADKAVGEVTQSAGDAAAGNRMQ